ncbi:uncharacterized protein VP01_5674g1, partial [Puccinia sorghi]
DYHTVYSLLRLSATSSLPLPKTCFFLPFTYKVPTPSNRHSENLSVVAVDLMGPFEPETMTGGKYALMIRDEIQLTVRWETQSKKKVKVLRSDNGGGFDSNKFAN